MFIGFVSTFEKYSYYLWNTHLLLLLLYQVASLWASFMAQLVKNLPAMWETWVPSLGWEDPLEKETATHSSILAWRIPWTVESMGSQWVRHDWMTFTSLGAKQIWARHLLCYFLDVWPPVSYSISLSQRMVIPLRGVQHPWSPLHSA